jgi:hypothetical protein
MKKLAILISVLCCALVAFGQTTPVILAPIPLFQSFLQSGTPNSFGCVFSYASGTTNPIPTWTDSTGATQNANPVILSGGGQGNIWIQSGVSYSLRIKGSGGLNCASGVTVATINGIGGGVSTLAVTVPFTPAPQFTVTSQNQLFQFTLTGNATALPLNVVGVTPPGLITFQIIQDVVGGHTFTWPTNVIGGAPIGTSGGNITTQEFVWNGTNAFALGPAVDGPGPDISAGGIVGTSLTVSGAVAASSSPTFFSIANAGTTGTSLFTLTKLNGSSSSTAVIAATTDTSGVVGICVANCSTSGNATIQQTGTTNCTFDGATTAGDFVSISSITAGNCHDAGLAPSGQNIGRVLFTNGSTGTDPILLFPPGSGTSLNCALQPNTVAVATNTPSIVQNCTFQAGALNVLGKSFRLTSGFTMTPAASYTLSLNWGIWNVSPSSLSTVASGTSATLQQASFSEVCTVVTAGSSGALNCSYVSLPYTSAGVTAATFPNQTFTSIDLTAAVNVGTLCTFGTAAVNSCSGKTFLLEQLN